MNAAEIRERAKQRREERRQVKRVAIPEWGDDAFLHFHLPPTLSEMQAATEMMKPIVAEKQASQADFDRVINHLVFNLAKDESGERVWTDYDEFDVSIEYPTLIRCVNEAGLLNALTEAMGGEADEAA